MSNCICFCHTLSHIAKGYGVETFIKAHAKFAVHTVERRLGQKLQLRYALQTSRVEDAFQAFQDVIKVETEQLQELWSGLLVDGMYHDHTTADGDGVEMAVEDERYVFDAHVRCNISDSAQPVTNTYEYVRLSSNRYFRRIHRGRWGQCTYYCFNASRPHTRHFEEVSQKLIVSQHGSTIFILTTFSYVLHQLYLSV